MQVVCGAPNVARGHQGAVRARWCAPARRQDDRRRGAARRQVAGHAVLGEGARAAGRRQRPADCSTPTRPSAQALTRLSAPRRRGPRGQRHAEPRRLLQRARARARARGAARLAARAARAVGRRRRHDARRFPVELGCRRALPAIRGPRACATSRRARSRRCGCASGCAGRASEPFTRSSTSRTTSCSSSASRCTPTTSTSSSGKIEVRLATAERVARAARRQVHRAARRRARDRRRARSGRPRRHHGRPIDGGERATSTSIFFEARSSRPPRSPAARGASGCTPTRRCVSSAASIRRSRCARSSARRSCCSRSAAARPGRSRHASMRRRVPKRLADPLAARARERRARAHGAGLAHRPRPRAPRDARRARCRRLARHAAARSDST